MRGKAVKKDSISIDILPPRPNRALRSLLSVALSSRWAKTVYHNYSKNIINQIKIVLDMGYTSAVARNVCTAKNTPRARKNIYYLLSLIHYLLSKVPGCANGFYPSAPLGVTFSGRIRRGVACVKSNMVYNCVRTWYTTCSTVTTSKFYG